MMGLAQSLLLRAAGIQIIKSPGKSLAEVGIECTATPPECISLDISAFCLQKDLPGPALPLRSLE